MITLDCGQINETLYTIMDDLRKKIVDYFIDENHTLNRRY